MANKKRVSAQKANMTSMAKAGGLKGFMKGGDVTEGLKKAQPGGESWDINPATLQFNWQQDLKRKLSKLVGGTGLTVAETKAAAKEKALLKASKSKQRNPKPGPNEY